MTGCTLEKMNTKNILFFSNGPYLLTLEMVRIK